MLHLALPALGLWLLIAEPGAKRGGSRRGAAWPETRARLGDDAIVEDAGELELEGKAAPDPSLAPRRARLASACARPTQARLRQFVSARPVVHWRENAAVHLMHGDD